MGQDISSSDFTCQDFQRYKVRLYQETEQLADWFKRGQLKQTGRVGGFEIEAWLVDRYGQPIPQNEHFLAQMNDPVVVPELSVFNIELNTPPLLLHGDALQRMHTNLAELWQRCQQIATGMDSTLVLIGTLPTLRKSDLSLAHMTDRPRYRAINEQIMLRHRGRPMRINIHGIDTLQMTHHNIMMEAAATSFQTHLQVGANEAAAFFNASTVLAAPMVALATNAPLLFGKRLWKETRIPLFEQAVSLADDPLYQRVTLGSGYTRKSLLELFTENLDHYPPLLPEDLHTEIDPLPHLRLHNGAIWRWNRPLLGFENNGMPHLRIEHRVMPAGPSIPDTIANAALYYGLVHRLAREMPAVTETLDFADSRANFYAAARYGLHAEVIWRQGRRVPLRQLLLEELLPLARQGLQELEIDLADITLYLDMATARIKNDCTGADWQLRFFRKNGFDPTILTLAYIEQQLNGQPVHEWRC